MVRSFEMLPLRFRPSQACWLAASLLLTATAASGGPRKRTEPQLQLSEAKFEGFAAGCTVELDAAAAGKTDAKGEFTIEELNPGDHYLHVDCPGQDPQTFFISPKPSQQVEISPKPPAAKSSPLEAAETHRELQRLVERATEERTAGQFDQAISDLRHATLLDPANPDLHRELGITFLLMKEWERARIEYLEAIKQDDTEPESHNGLGYSLEKLGELERAAYEFRVATQLDPDDATYREQYIEALTLLEAQKDKEKKKKR